MKVNSSKSLKRLFVKLKTLLPFILLELVRKSVEEWAYMYGKRYVIGGVFAKVMITRDLQDVEVIILPCHSSMASVFGRRNYFVFIHNTTNSYGFREFCPHPFISRKVSSTVS